MLAALLVTTGVLPMAAVNLLADYPATTSSCQASWLLCILAAHTVLFTLPCLAWENNTRLRGFPLPCITLTLFMAASWLIGIILVTTQWTGGFGPTYCEVTSPSDIKTYTIYTSTVGVILVLVPISLSVAIHTRTLLEKNTHPRRRQRHTPPHADPPTSSTSLKPTTVVPITIRDLALPATNLAVTVIGGALWAAGIASTWWVNTPSKSALDWFSIAAAVIGGFIYAGYKPFREAYIQLFHYCCCKTTVSMSRRGRGDTAPIAVPINQTPTRSSDVRVHIIPGYNMYSTGSSHREFRPAPIAHKTPRPKDMRRSKHPAKKDVYEL